MEAFAGIGGWSLGAYMAGWSFHEHYFSEIDPYASAVFQRHFPDAIPLGDIRGVSKKDLPDGDWYLAGGFPCFPAGALVLTIRGLVPIEKVRVEDLVYTHTGRFCRVLRTGSRLAPKTIVVSGQGHSGLEVTPEHPFLTESGDGSVEWTQAVWLAGKKWASIPNFPALFGPTFKREGPQEGLFNFGLVEKVKMGRENVPVYNLEVEGDNSYSVDGLIVHNCQDISVSGRQAGLEVGQQSSLWFEFARIIAEFRPRFALVENVGNLTSKGLYRVLSDLYEAGYDAGWFDIRASDVGAPHRRERLWIVAYPKGARLRGEFEAGDAGAVIPAGRDSTVGVPRSAVIERPGDGHEALAEDVAHSVSDRQSTRRARQVSGGDIAKISILRGGIGCAWPPEPGVLPVADGVSSWVGRHWSNRIKCAGNALLPQIAELVWAAVGELDAYMEIPAGEIGRPKF
jgi:DNA (cytosine-5)-methyltransferase 1